MRDVSVHPIAIVGAGIAGLAQALSLAKAGFRTSVFESAAVLAPSGAGLQLSPNAISVLKQLGLDELLEARAVRASSVSLRAAKTDRLIASVPVGSPDEGYLALHRADLQAVLLEVAEANERISLHLGHKLCALRQNDDAVTLEFEADRASTLHVETDMVICADGVHSAAANLLGLAPAVPSRLIAHRIAVVSDEATSDTGIEAWLSPARHAVSYPMRRNGERNVVVVAAQNDSDALSSFFWNGRLADYISAGRYLGNWPLLTLPTKSRMRALGRCVFIGDAAHAMFPFAAQGAAMAIEDAWILARELSLATDHQAAITSFHRLRLPRVQRVIDRTHFHRKVYHLPFPADLVRNFVLGTKSPASLRRDLAWLYDWRAPPMSESTVD